MEHWSNYLYFYDISNVFSLIAAMTIVLNIRNIEYMNDWGKVLGTLAFQMFRW